MPNTYSLELYVSKCIFEVTMNGLFIYRADAKNGTSLNYPLNTELIGEGNKLKISLLPTLLDDGTIPKIKDINIIGTIKLYEPGAISGPETGILIQNIFFDDLIAQADTQLSFGTDITKLFPMSKEFEFDNEGLSFRDKLIDAPQITDKKLLLDYAEYLRDVFGRKDLEALYKEYKPKIDDYVKAYPEEFPDPIGWYRDLFENDVFPGGPITNFKRDDIGLRSWCDDRVWEIYVKPMQKFFTNEGLDGDINEIEVYVGLVNNQLKIIR